MNITDFVEAERKHMTQEYVGIKQRIWNIVKNNPNCTTNFILQSVSDVPRASVRGSIHTMLQREMLDVSGKLSGKGPPTNKLVVVDEVYRLKSLPMKTRKPPKPAIKVKDIETPKLSGYFTSPKGVDTTEYKPPTLLDKVKTAPFSEVQEIYAWLKDTFK